MKRRLLILDTEAQTYWLETQRIETMACDEREDYWVLSGEALCQHVLRRDPACLVIARGPLAFLAGNKATVGYFSPLTGMPHYSFVGGRAAAQLFNLGLDAVVLIGAGGGAAYVSIAGRAPSLQVRFEGAGALPGGGRAAFYRLVESELGGDAQAGSVLVTGEGAAHGYLAANLAVDGLYHAGRGGAGAVFGRMLRGLVLHGEPCDQARFFAARGADPAFARNPNQALAPRLGAYTARLAGPSGGTIAKLHATGGDEGPPTLPARNARQMGYELADLGARRMLLATRDGHTGCHWCPVDCRHWHWVEADYAPGGRDRLLDDFEPTYATFAMLGLAPAEDSFAARLALWREVERRLILPIEQLGCDVIDVGVGLAALFEGLERGLIPAQDVPLALTEARSTLDAAVAAVEALRGGVDGARYPALRAVGDGPQALARRYPGMQDVVFTCGERTLGNAGHGNALWTFMMAFSRFFGHYAGQIYKIEAALPADPDDAALRDLFRRVVAEMFQREYWSILCNALSCCAFTFVVFSAGGEGTRLDDEDLLARTMAQYGIQTTREDIEWFAQAFWAQSLEFKAGFGWRPPVASDLPRRVYEALSLVLGRAPEELARWMALLIEEWKNAAASVMHRFGYTAAWLKE